MNEGFIFQEKSDLCAFKSKIRGEDLGGNSVSITASQRIDIKLYFMMDFEEDIKNTEVVVRDKKEAEG